MRRIAVLMLLVGIAILPAATRSTAAPAAPTTPTITTVNGYCFASPYNTFVPCPVTPTVRPLIPINKSIQVSGGIAMPAGTTQYNVTITSRHACFSLAEPIDVYALGHPGSAVLSPISPPPPAASTTGSTASTTVDSATGLATLLLEVLDKAVGPEGVTLKAVWTREQIERFAQVIAAAAPTATPTPLTPVPTSTATVTPVGTPTATIVPTPTPGPFTVSGCVDPNVVSGLSLGGDFATLYGQTLPGAVCTAAVEYYKRSGTSLSLASPEALGTVTPTVTPGTASYSFYAVPQPTEVFDGSAQTALSDQLVVYPWHPYTLADAGIALVTCNFDNQAPITACTGFLIAQNYDADVTPYFADMTPQDRVTQIHLLEANLCPPGSVLTP